MATSKMQNGLIKRGKYWHMYYYDLQGKYKGVSTKKTTKREAILFANKFKEELKVIKQHKKRVLNDEHLKNLLIKELGEETYKHKIDNFNIDTLEEFRDIEHNENLIIHNNSEDATIEEFEHDRQIEEEQKNIGKNKKERNELAYQRFSIPELRKFIDTIPNIANSTKSNSKNALKQVENSGINCLLEIQNKPGCFNKYVKYMQNNIKTGSSYNVHNRNLKSLYNKVCNEYGYDFVNPFDRINKRKETRKNLTIPDYKFINNLIITLEENKEYRLMFAIAFGCHSGLRRNEINSLDSKWINYERNNLTIPAKDNKFESKSRQTRIIPLSTTLIELLDKHKPKGKFMKNFIKPFYDKKIRDKYNIDFSIRDMRNYFAYRLLEKNHNYLDIQKYLGHSSINTTLKYISKINHVVSDKILDI